jgi:hypothetical protein
LISKANLAIAAATAFVPLDAARMLTTKRIDRIATSNGN